MDSTPRVTLEQWRTFVAVVEAGGQAAAAARLHKSQSTVTYAVKQLQALLGVTAFEARGRRAVPTATGQLLYQRAKAILEEAEGLERSARRLSAGWEPEIAIAVEMLFPTSLLLAALARFGEESPHTHVEVYESVIGGTQEMLADGRVDLALTPHVPQGFESAPLMTMRFVPLAHPGHALHRLGRPLTMRDLRKHRQVVVRDTGTRRDKKAVFIQAEERWTVGHFATSVSAVAAGHGFAWFPVEKVGAEIAAGLLAPLPMAEGGERRVEVHLAYRDRESAGPGVLRLAQVVRDCVAAARDGAAGR
jgi:DNA-binding transcriptional LysR family regulator